MNRKTQIGIGRSVVKIALRLSRLTVMFTITLFGLDDLLFFIGFSLEFHML
jgi:hypothetical protein